MSAKSQTIKNHLAATLKDGRIKDAVAIYKQHRKHLDQNEKENVFIHAMASPDSKDAYFVLAENFPEFRYTQVAHMALRFGRDDVLSHLFTKHGYDHCASDELMAQAAYSKNIDALMMIAEFKNDRQFKARLERKEQPFKTLHLGQGMSRLSLEEGLLSLDVKDFKSYINVYFSKLTEENNPYKIEALSRAAVWGGKKDHMNALADLLSNNTYHRARAMSDFMVRNWWGGAEGVFKKMGGLDTENETVRHNIIHFIKNAFSWPGHPVETVFEQILSNTDNPVCFLYTAREIIPAHLFQSTEQLEEVWEERFVDRKWRGHVLETLSAYHTKLVLDNAVDENMTNQKKPKQPKKM